MHVFDYIALKDQKWDSETVAYFAAIYEARGKQELYLKHAPQELEKLGWSSFPTSCPRWKRCAKRCR